MQDNLAGRAHWIFDLDNTLYRADANFFGQIDKKMTDFISRHFDMETEDASQLRKDYWAEYGTTLSGLMAVHDLDPAEFLDYVHDVDLSLLSPDPELRRQISRLEGRRLIFTNGSKAHARNVGSLLNLFDLFDGSFGIEDANFMPKPKRAPYEIFNKAFDVDPRRAVFFEDNIQNLEVPKQMGMTTVLVVSDEDFSNAPEVVRPSGQTAKADWVDYVTNDLPLWLSRRT
jgi:putative hydrolase of the HAD superfamily